MCMTFGYNPQINFCHFFHSLNLVIFGLNYYRSLWTLFEIKTIGGGIRVPWTLFLVIQPSLKPNKFISHYHNDVAYKSEITPCNETDGPLVVYRFFENIVTSITMLRTYIMTNYSVFRTEMRFQSMINRI